MCPQSCLGKSSTTRSGSKISHIRRPNHKYTRNSNIWVSLPSMATCTFSMMMYRSAWNSSNLWVRIGWLLSRISMCSERRNARIFKCIRLDHLCRRGTQSSPTDPGVDSPLGLMFRLRVRIILNRKWTYLKQGPRRVQIWLGCSNLRDPSYGFRSSANSRSKKREASALSDLPSRNLQSSARTSDKASKRLEPEIQGNQPVRCSKRPTLISIID